MDKHYTPSIEEFHVGFEYEEKIEIDLWEKTSITQSCDLEFVEDDLEHNNGSKIRVKYLDKEDIEEVVVKVNPWWRYTRDDNYYTAWELSEYKEIWISINNPTGIWITHINANNSEQNNVPFIIKNKSELKVSMKQLNITL